MSIFKKYKRIDRCSENRRHCEKLFRLNYRHQQEMTDDDLT